MPCKHVKMLVFTGKSETYQEKSGAVQASVVPNSCALIVTENPKLPDDLMTC